MHTDLSQENNVTLRIIIFEKVPCKYSESERQFLLNWNLLGAPSSCYKKHEFQADFTASETSET